MGDTFGVSPIFFVTCLRLAASLTRKDPQVAQDSYPSSTCHLVVVNIRFVCPGGHSAKRAPDRIVKPR